MKNKSDLLIAVIFIILNVIAFLMWNEWSFTLIGLSIIILGVYLKVVVIHRIEVRDQLKK